jgi:hypothetical protein
MYAKKTISGTMLGMCYILCMASGNMSPFFLIFCVASIFMSIVGRFFGTWFFFDSFLFQVKELGLLTNPGHYIRA